MSSFFLPVLVAFLIEDDFVFRFMRIVSTDRVKNFTRKLGLVLGDDDTVRALVFFTSWLEFDFQHRILYHLGDSSLFKAAVAAFCSASCLFFPRPTPRD